MPLVSSGRSYVVPGTAWLASTLFAGAGQLSAVEGSAGFNNLTNWPALTNRPSLSGSTLTWIGPVGGGPSTSNDPTQSLVLSASGSITTNTNGQSITGLNITGSIVVNHNNVTIRTNNIKASDPNGFCIQLSTGVSGFLIEDNLIDGSKNTLSGVRNLNGGGAYSNGTIRRNAIVGVENGLTLWPGNSVVIIDNCFTGFGNSGNPAYDADMIELYTCNIVDIEHNMFNSANSQLNNNGMNSRVNLSNLGATTNVTLNNNMFANPGDFAIIIDCNNSFSAGAMTWSATNNGFFNISPNSPRRTASPNQPPNQGNSGNYTAATITATSGTLIGGTGQI